MGPTKMSKWEIVWVNHKFISSFDTCEPHEEQNHYYESPAQKSSDQRELVTFCPLESSIDASSLASLSNFRERYSFIFIPEKYKEFCVWYFHFGQPSNCRYYDVDQQRHILSRRRKPCIKQVTVTFWKSEGSSFCTTLLLAISPNPR